MYFFGSLTCYLFILCPLFRFCLTVACYRTNSRANQSGRFRKGAGLVAQVVRRIVNTQRERETHFEQRVETERCWESLCGVGVFLSSRERGKSNVHPSVLCYR